MSLEDDSRWCASGCLAYHLDCNQHVGGFMHLNNTKILELTFNNGFNPRIQKQLGLKTGDASKFTLEQLTEAFLKQEDYFAEKLRKDYEIRRTLELGYPLESGHNAVMYYDYTIPYGMTTLKGGTAYPITTVMWVGDRGA